MLTWRGLSVTKGRPQCRTQIGNRPSQVNQLGAWGTLGYAASGERCLGQGHSRWWGRARVYQLRTVQKPGTPQTLGLLFCLMRTVFRVGRGGWKLP